MSGTLRKLKRQKDRDSDELPIVQQRLPTGRVLTDPVKGTFVSLPMLGSIAVRDRDRIPLVMLVVALLNPEKVEDGLVGMLQIELPLYIETNAATVAALERYGWSGRAWKEGDAHWPTGDTESLEQLRGLLSQAGLQASLTFPPDPITGEVRAQPVEVTRATGSFLMPPLEEPLELPDPVKTQALHDLVLAYQDFYPLGQQTVSTGGEETSLEAGHA